MGLAHRISINASWLLVCPAKLRKETGRRSPSGWREDSCGPTRGKDFYFFKGNSSSDLIAPGRAARPGPVPCR